MKLKAIEFNGYMRLLKASCNVDGRAIAFVGPNEAGKSSALRGLEWLTDEDQGALPTTALNRRQQPSRDEPVVRAYFRIDDSDIEAIQRLKLDCEPAISKKSLVEFRISKKRNGAQTTGITGSFSRNAKPFAKAEGNIEGLQKAQESVRQEIPSPEISASLEDTLDAALSTLDSNNLDWDSERVGNLNEAIDDLETTLNTLDTVEHPSRRLQVFTEKLRKSLPLINVAAAAAKFPEPESEIRSLLAQRAPKFLLFSDSDRDLVESYDLSDETIRSNPPAPLQNLLSVAGSTVSDIWAAINSGDITRLRTLQRRINETLRSRIQPMWTQSQITIQLELNQGGLLEVNIEELDSPEFVVTSFAERSDGLRAFLGLICFLVAADLEIPPVLMIDEAERNLHYDAQADLVRVFTNNLNVHKVIYTTHSPGCLPLDLGTGIRVVARDPEDSAVSILKSNFWTGSEPGFSHLLFEMGAQAAAFSAFRQAVLTEGVSDMILLPTMLRNATGGKDLSFQVAFGLSNLPVVDAASSVALITTFLVDGDNSGNTKKRQLQEIGIPDSHIFQLPRGKAIEDLVKRTQYIHVVNEFLQELGRPAIPVGALDKTKTIAKAVDDYAKYHLTMPEGVSHKIIATRLADLREGLDLSPSGTKFLLKLRSDLEQAFTKSYVLGS